VRTFFIWFFGLIACGFIGGIIGAQIDPYGLTGLWSFIAGLATFACLRLWIVPSARPAPKSSASDQICRASIDAAIAVGARTPREAAEITAGRPLTDQEWANHRSAWDRNW
jgi:hypothetical protein